MRKLSSSFRFFHLKTKRKTLLLLCFLGNYRWYFTAGKCDSIRLARCAIPAAICIAVRHALE